MADLGQASGELGEQESMILKQMLKAKDLEVVNVMTPRTVIFSVSQAMTTQEFVQHHAHPVFSDSIYASQLNDIVGYVFRNDILIAEEKHPDKPLQSLKIDLLVLPEPSNILNAFKKMCQRKLHIALVVNEYGTGSFTHHGRFN